MRKFILDTRDDIVHAVSKISTSNRIWTDDQLLRKLRTLSINGAANLTRDELNRKLGPANKNINGFEWPPLGLYRHHWSSHNKLRCAYFLLGKPAQPGVIIGDPGWGKVKFPQEAAAGDMGEPATRQPSTKPPPRNQRRGRVQLGSTGETPHGKRQQKDRNAEPPETADLIVSKNQEQLILRVSQIEDLTVENGELNEMITNLQSEKAAVEEENEELRNQVASLRASDETEDQVVSEEKVNEGAKQLRSLLRQLGRTNETKRRVLKRLVGILSPHERAILVAELKVEDITDVCLERLAAEIDDLAKATGMRHEDATLAIFDHNGMPKLQPALDQFAYALKRPNGNYTQDSLLVNVLRTLVISPSSQVKLQQARSALDEGRPWRSDHQRDKSKPGHPYVRPALSPILTVEGEPSELSNFCERLRRQQEMSVLTAAASIVQSRLGGSKTTTPLIMSSLALEFIGGVAATGNEFGTKLAITLSSKSNKEILKLIGEKYAAGVVRLMSEDVRRGAVTFLIIGDNYAVIRWTAHNRYDKDFTQIANTFSLIAYSVSCSPEYPLQTTPERPPAHPRQISFDQTLDFFWKNRHAFIPEDETLIVDLGKIGGLDSSLFPRDLSDGFASLKDFLILQSLLARSSSVNDLDSVVLTEFARKMRGAGLPGVDKMVLFDAEIFLVTVTRGLLKYDDDVKTVCLLLASFHLQKHGLESMLADPTLLTRIWAPFFTLVLNYRSRHFREQARNLGKSASESHSLDATDEELDETMRALSPFQESGDDDSSHGIDQDDVVDLVSDAVGTYEEDDGDEEAGTSSKADEKNHGSRLASSRRRARSVAEPKQGAKGPSWTRRHGEEGQAKDKLRPAPPHRPPPVRG